MTSHTTTPCLPQSEIETTKQLFDNWFDPVEAGLRDRAREFLQAMPSLILKRNSIGQNPDDYNVLEDGVVKFVDRGKSGRPGVRLKK